MKHGAGAESTLLVFGAVGWVAGAVNSSVINAKAIQNILYRQCDSGIVVAVAIYRLYPFCHLLVMNYVSLIDQSAKVSYFQPPAL